MILKPPELYLYERIVRAESLNEEKSLSEEVKNLTEAVADAILQDLKKNEQVFRETNVNNWQKVAYKCNTDGVRVHLSPDLGINRDIILRYKVYLFDDPTTQDNSKNMSHIFDNSGAECDFDNNAIKVATYIYKGSLGRGWIEDVWHEASHYFPNYKGEKKDDALYAQLGELVKSGEREKMDIGWTLYYTFPREQDKFAKNFYDWLMKSKKGTKGVDFEELLQDTEYGRFLKLAKRAQTHGEETISQIIEPLGFSTSEYRRRINIADKRFRRKMMGAFEKFLIDRRKDDFADKHRDFNYT